jgi:hypothetical protein
MSERLHTIIERVYGLVVGASFAVAGFALVVLGLTFLPVIGILAGIPLISLSVYFMRMSPVVEETIEGAEGEKWCSWSPFTCPWSPAMNKR